MLKKILQSVPFATLLGIPMVAAMGCSSTPVVEENDAVVVGVEPGDIFTEDRTADLLVKGLTCPFCVQNVDQQISAVSGVDDVHVDLATGKVRVLLSKDQPASAEDLTSAVSSSGFTLDKIDMPR